MQRQGFDEPGGDVRWRSESDEARPREVRTPRLRLEDSFERTVMLPSDAGGEPVQAALEGGVLTVTIAKRPRQSARAVEIEVP